MGMLADLVLETTNAPGTGTCTLLGAPPDRVSFAWAYSTTTLVYYVLDDNNNSEWGVGTFVPGASNTLQRTTVLGNTSAAGNTSKLNFTGLTKVYNSLPSARTVYVDNTNTVIVPAGGRFGTVAGGTPIGGGMSYFGSTAPAGWLFCAGQGLNTGTYAALFGVLQYAYGGSGTTFNLPDLRGRIPVGLDNMGGTSAARMSGVCASTTIGTVFGNQYLHAHGHTVAITDSQHTHGVTEPVNGHNHTITDPQHAHGLPGAVIWNSPPGTGIGGGSPNYYFGNTTNFASTGITATNWNTTGLSINPAWSTVTSGTATSTGAGNGQNVQPSLICNYIIFAGV